MVNPPSDPYGHARQAAAIAATKARVAAAQADAQRGMYVKIIKVARLHRQYG